MINNNSNLYHNKIISTINNKLKISLEIFNKNKLQNLNHNIKSNSLLLS